MKNLLTRTRPRKRAALRPDAPDRARSPKVAAPKTGTGTSFPKRALSVFPGGSNGEFGIPAELLPVLERGQGCRVWDTNGREYVDLTMAWGAALVGHAHPKILEAATRQASLG